MYKYAKIVIYSQTKAQGRGKTGQAHQNITRYSLPTFFLQSTDEVIRR